MSETVGTEESDVLGAYDDLVEQFKWAYALVTILLEHQGDGRVEISKQLLESHSFASRLSVTPTEYDTYVIEVVRD